MDEVCREKILNASKRCTCDPERLYVGQNIRKEIVSSPQCVSRTGENHRDEEELDRIFGDAVYKFLGARIFPTMMLASDIVLTPSEFRRLLANELDHVDEHMSDEREGEW